MGAIIQTRRVRSGRWEDGRGGCGFFRVLGPAFFLVDASVFEQRFFAIDAVSVSARVEPPITRRRGARVSDHYVTRSPVTGEEYDRMRSPRFTEIPTFMRAPLAESLDGLDIGLVGRALRRRCHQPHRGGATGPREIRNMSSLMRPHPPRDPGSTLTRSATWPTSATCASAPSSRRPRRSATSRASTASFTRPGWCLSARAVITRSPIRSTAPSRGNRPVGMVHIDAHTDTADEAFGARFHHGSPFRLATEEGLLDPKRTIQIGIRGAQFFPPSPGTIPWKRVCAWCSWRSSRGRAWTQ